MQGWIKIHRQLVTSEIFANKPPEWLKLWLYFLVSVNHIDGSYERGEQFFNASEVARYCNVKVGSVYKFVKWAKLAKQVATRKTTRGFYLKVLQYEVYQDNETTRGDTKSDTKGETEAKQRRNRGDTIIKECKNVRMQEDTTNVVEQALITEEKPLEKKEEYGNLEINKILEALKQTIVIDSFKENQTWERRYAKHCLNLINKIGKDKFRHRLTNILQDEFKAKNCNSIKYLYGELKSYRDKQNYEKPKVKVNSPHTNRNF